jgi:DnaJ-domain-containing protein 1
MTLEVNEERSKMLRRKSAADAEAAATAREAAMAKEAAQKARADGEKARRAEGEARARAEARAQAEAHARAEATRARAKKEAEEASNAPPKLQRETSRIMEARTHYEVLKVDRNASADKIRKAYLKLTPKVHPDKNNHPKAKESFQKLGDAKDVLTNQVQRGRYDASLGKTK